MAEHGISLTDIFEMTPAQLLVLSAKAWERKRQELIMLAHLTRVSHPWVEQKHFKRFMDMLEPPVRLDSDKVKRFMEQEQDG